MKDNQVVILGLQFGHDSGVSILINGIAKCNLIRERYNRSKHSFGVNVGHIEEALLDAKVKVEDIDMIAVTSTQCWELVVVDRPKDLKIEALSEDNLIEAISIENHPSFGVAVQWHAEFEPEKKENY